MTEQPILPCPYCGNSCLSKEFTELYYVRCSCCTYKTKEYEKPEAIAVHNELCDLVEKGRECEQQRHYTKLNELTARCIDSDGQRDEMVELLREWNTVIMLTGQTQLKIDTSAYLARIDKRGGE